MGKREEEKKPRQSRDFYPTRDVAAADALKPFLYRPVGPTRYVEPCAGGGDLIDLLASVAAPATCVAAYDIDPQRADVTQRNCLLLSQQDVKDAHCFITNPPYQWDMLQPVLQALPQLLPTWLLLPADSMHNKRMAPFLACCSDIVSVGRLWWFEDSNGKKVKGVDNFAWFKLIKEKADTRFHYRDKFNK